MRIYYNEYNNMNLTRGLSVSTDNYCLVIDRDSISSLDYVTKESREICMRRSSVQLQARMRVVQSFVFEAERKR